MLNSQRTESNIPRAGSDPATPHWVYPSEMQFLRALQRKNKAPEVSSIPHVVAIHNAVNERTWAHILAWERGESQNCPDVRLSSFMGKPLQKSLKARWNMLWGYVGPFDRHDWTVNRCGQEVRYIIDFYKGERKSDKPSDVTLSNVYLDVRPALDSWLGWSMRFRSWLGWKDVQVK